MKCGRPLLLGEHLDSMVQKYLKKGGVVTARVAIAVLEHSYIHRIVLS